MIKFVFVIFAAWLTVAICGLLKLPTWCYFIVGVVLGYICARIADWIAR